MIDALKTWLERQLWREELARMPWWRRATVHTARVVVAVLRDLFVEGQISLRAMSLVYTTLISIVPLLAFSFSVLKGFGVHQSVVAPYLTEAMSPLGEQGAEITAKIIGFVDNVDARVLGLPAIVLLLFTAYSMIKKVEDGFNFVWQVSNPRSLGRRLSEYLSVLLIGPLTMVAAMGITASLTRRDTVEEWVNVGFISEGMVQLGQVMPYLLIIGMFVFLYAFLPNTRVKLFPALIGAITAGILWQTGGRLFAVFVANANTQLLIYSSFAILLLFLIWLFVSWMILLIGADVAFYLQHPEYARTGRRSPVLGNRTREAVGLAVMQAVARSHLGEDGPVDDADLAARIRLPSRSLQFVVERLFDAGLLEETAEGHLLPGRDLHRITLAEIMGAVRSGGEDGYHDPRTSDEVGTLLDELDSTRDQRLGERTLAELAER